jgi:O-antigen/teichoic acid export membrane protein
VLALVPPVLKLADRFFLNLNYYVTLEDIGIYSIAYKFGMIINMFLIMPLQKSWLPMMYKIGVEKESHTYHRDLLFYYGVVGGAFFLAISFFHREMIQIVATEDYLKYAFVVPLIALAYYLNGFRQFFIAGAALQDKTPRLAAASAVTIGLSLLLNFVLIRQYGVSGAAWASLGSHAILVLLIYVASQRVARINWYWWRLMKLAIVLAVSFGVVTYLNSEFANQALLWSISGFVGYIILLILTGAVGKRELSGIKYLFRRENNEKTELL